MYLKLLTIWLDKTVAIFIFDFLALLMFFACEFVGCWFPQEHSRRHPILTITRVFWPLVYWSDHRTHSWTSDDTSAACTRTIVTQTIVGRVMKDGILENIARGVRLFIRFEMWRSCCRQFEIMNGTSWKHQNSCWDIAFSVIDFLNHGFRLSHQVIIHFPE